jgi:hypothetical protein
MSESGNDIDEASVAAAIWALKKDLDERHGENTNVGKAHRRSIEELSEKVDQVLDGFPKGDPGSHRRYHESIINRNEARAELYKTVRAELITKGMWAAIVLVCSAVWYFARQQKS